MNQPPRFDWDNPADRQRPVGDLFPVDKRSSTQHRLLQRLTKNRMWPVATIDDLVRLSPAQIGDIPNVGPTMLEEIRDALEDHNLTLSETDSPL